MNRASVGFMTIAVLVIGAAASQPVTPERPQTPGGGDQPPEAARPKQEAAQPAAGAGWGQFRGRVVYRGQPPEARVVADPAATTVPRNQRGEPIAGAPLRRLPGHEVIAQRGAPIRSERLVVDPESQGVANALVYLVEPTAVRDEARRAAPKSLRFRADRGVFVPHVLALIEGTEILVATDDRIVYNLHAQLPGTQFLVAETDTRLEQPRNLALSAGMNCLFGGFPEGRTVSLSVRPKAGKPRPIPVNDDVHSWMKAWWLVLDHPYFAVTDAHGAFAIPDVPAGPQQVRVWQESVSPPGLVFEGEVVIQDQGATTRDFAIEPGQVAIGLRQEGQRRRDS